MITQVVAETGCFPYMYLTDEEAWELNEAQFDDTPFVGRHVLYNRELLFLPPTVNETEDRRTHPDGPLFSLFEQPTFVAGYNLAIAGWNVEILYPNYGRPDPKYFNRNLPTPSRNWAFDDKDGAFEDYDYADDEDNFARDDRDMARALATKDTDDRKKGNGN